jgi:hypothetical protein
MGEHQYLELVYPADRFDDLVRVADEFDCVVMGKPELNGFALQIPRAIRDRIVEILGEPVKNDGVQLRATGDRERFYEEQVEPALIELARQCKDNGLSLLAFCEYGDGYGHVQVMSSEASRAMRIIEVAGQTNGDIDSLVFAVGSWGGSRSLAMKIFGWLRYLSG